MKGQRRARQRPGHADGLDAGEGKVAGFGIDQVVGGLVPVVPAVVTGKENLVFAGRAARDADGHGARLAAALGVAHHLGAGNGIDQDLGEFDFQRAVQAVQAALVDLLLHGGVHHVVGVTQDDGRHGVYPVDVLVAVNVREPRTLGVSGVNRTNADGRNCSPGG